MPNLPKAIALVGVTAAGKTALAEELALHLGGELISCDAKQLYRGMDIGTAKEKDLRVPQHLIDCIEPGTKVTVGMYQQVAYEAIDDCLSRGVLPILVGGSMLYAQAVIAGYQFNQGPLLPRYDWLILGIDIERAVAAERIAKRSALWRERGLVQEVIGLRNAGVSDEWLEACGMEYRWITRYLRGEVTEQEAFDQAIAEQRAYVKRQQTWWRHHGPVSWISNYKEAEKQVSQFLGKEIPAST